MATLLRWFTGVVLIKNVVMKKIFLYIIVLAAGLQTAEAQDKKSKSTKAKKGTATVTKMQQQPVASNPISLSDWGTYNAKNKSQRSFSITDPTILTLNRRANGEPIPFNSKEILGVPKITYGLGNGQLFFRSRGATTSGTGTGNGTVGTGSGLGPIGTSGLALGVNGKSPYAGPIMDGIIVSGLPAAVQPEKPKRNQKAKNQK